MRFDNLFSFEFSERPGTAAADFDDVVEPETRKSRLNILQARQRQYTREFMERFQDQVVEILVDGPSRFDPTVWCGKTQQNITVNFTGQAPAGTLARVRVDQVKSNTFFGTLLQQA